MAFEVDDDDMSAMSETPGTSSSAVSAHRTRMTPNDLDNSNIDYVGGSLKFVHY